MSQTLPFNLINSSDYFEKEFVLLDYNSEDGLYNWAKTHLSYWENKGVLRYLRTQLPKHFNAAHAKNIAHKNATGDILCNLDCDNFIMRGFCQYLENIFQINKRIFLSSSQDIFGNDGCCGKIAIKKEHFYSVNGYDESEVLGLGWGWDDVNFRFRAQNYNVLEPIICDIKYNAAIHHSNKIRTSNFLEKDIKKTQAVSLGHLNLLAVKKDYIANKEKNWGHIEDLKFGL